MEFPLQPQMSQWIRPRLNRRNPHELHWRRELPEWHGSIDKTHGHLYGHLADTRCCLQCGAVPCPYDHTEHERLKLADLEFVKDLAKERRELKEKVSKLEMYIRNMEDKNLQLKGEKMMLVEHVRQYERMQQEWEKQKMLMEGEIDRLKMLNADNLKKLQSYKKDQERLRILTKRVENLEKENAMLQEENTKYRGLISRQQDEIQGLEQRNKELHAQSEQSQVKIRRLRVQLDETSEELGTLRKTLAEREGRVDELEIELTRITQELELKTKEFYERDAANQQTIRDLQNKLKILQLNYDRKEVDITLLQARIKELLEEIERLKGKLSSDSRFMKFVNIKRECNDLKEQNETLMVKVHEHDKVCQTLPFMKASGRVKSARHNRSPPMSKRPCSAATSRTSLNRPKSARTLVALDSGSDTDEQD